MEEKNWAKVLGIKRYNVSSVILIIDGKTLRILDENITWCEVPENESALVKISEAVEPERNWTKTKVTICGPVNKISCLLMNAGYGTPNSIRSLITSSSPDGGDQQEEDMEVQE